MFLYKYLYIISLTLITVETQDVDIISNLIDGVILKEDLYQILAVAEEKVEVKLYYECLCPDCRLFDTMNLEPTVEKLASNLDLKPYPYGNAETIDKGNATYEFNCQHGPAECYGNKLHACAIDYLGNVTKAIFFNSCMMESSQKGRGSDDEAADKCGKSMDIDSEAIKQCAKGPQGTTLLKYYGDESKKVGFKYVPYILINGAPNDGSNFMRDVCAAFKTPPPASKGVSHRASRLNENWNRTFEEVPSDIDTVKDKVVIEVYYETLCPFSVNFFVSQLKPAVERLGSHLDIHLIPYGNAKTRRVSSGHYKFSCQHGIPECFGNTVQACAIDVLRNTTRAVYFNTCLMQFTSLSIDYQYFRSAFNWCGYKEKADVKEIWKCVYNKRGSILLKRHGDKTHALGPPYVPYLMIDGSQQYQDEATENLVATVCQMLKPRPRECS